MKNKNTNKIIFISIGLAIIVSGVILGWPYIMKLFSSPEKKIQSKYSDNLYLLEHDFVYAATLDLNGMKNTVYMVKKPNNEFDVWQPGQTANRIYGTAFMIDSSGVCITSSYALTPWNNRNDHKMLTDLLIKEFGLSESQVSLKGYSLRVSLKRPDGDTAKLDYRPLGYTPGSDDQVTFIEKTDTGTTFLSQKVLFPNVVNADAEKLFLLSATDNETNPGLAVKTSVFTLEKNSILNPEDFRGNEFFTFQQKQALPEGAPVFNRKGEIIGVYSCYNNKTEATNNIMLIPIRSSMELSSYLRRLSGVEMDESFKLLGKRNNQVDPIYKPKEWVTVLGLRDDSLIVGFSRATTPYSSDFFPMSCSVNEETNEALWSTRAVKISNRNTRLKVTIDKLVTSDDYLAVLKIRIREALNEKAGEEEIFSIQYDAEGIFIENLWDLDGFYSFVVEGMDGCKFKIELQTEK